MLWAAYALPVLLKVLRGLKNSLKDARLALSVYTRPIIRLCFHSNHERVQSHVCFRSINLNEASPISVKFTRLNCARERGRNNRGITTWQGTRKRVAPHRRCTVKWERSSTCKETCAFVSRHALTAMLPLPHCNSSMSKHPTVAHQKQQQ